MSYLLETFNKTFTIFPYFHYSSEFNHIISWISLNKSYCSWRLVFCSFLAHISSSQLVTLRYSRILLLPLVQGMFPWTEKSTIVRSLCQSGTLQTALCSRPAPCHCFFWACSRDFRMQWSKDGGGLHVCVLHQTPHTHIASCSKRKAFLGFRIPCGVLRTVLYIARL